MAPLEVPGFFAANLQVLPHREVRKDEAVVRNVAHALLGDVIGRFPFMSSPLNLTLPVFGGVSPMMLLMVVVLPAPFRPRRQTSSPPFT